jgi:hypothetical protein
MNVAMDCESPSTFYRVKAMREGRQCCGGETIDDEWSSSMLSFQ